MRVLVTGSAGFIGSHVVARLKQDGHEVTSVDLEGNPRTDIRYWFRTDRNQHPLDLVIHCAAVVGGRILIENSPLLYARNLEIDAKLFQWAEWAKPKRIIYISSVAAYPVHLQQGEYPLKPLFSSSYDFSKINVISGDAVIPPVRTVIPAHILREWDSPGISSQPDELYGWAKLTGEMLAGKSSIPVSIPRPFTVYGDGQDDIFPFMNIMNQVRDKKDPVTVWGSGNQVRDFIHVDDVVNAMLAMAEKEIDGAVNFCTGVGTSLNELIAMAAEKAGYSPAIEHLDKTEGLPHRVGSPDKLHEFYVPQITLEEGIRRALL